MERIVAGQRVPVPPAILPAGSPGSRTDALRLRLLRPDDTVRVVSGTHTSIVRDRDDALIWRYLGTADQSGVHEWQWEYEGVVIQYGRFRVMGTGFSE